MMVADMLCILCALDTVTPSNSYVHVCEAGCASIRIVSMMVMIIVVMVPVTTERVQFLYD